MTRLLLVLLTASALPAAAQTVTTGDRWDGERLDVETTNGGVQLVVPAGYSADLETGTTNGDVVIERG